MVTFPPAFSTPLFTASATVKRVPSAIRRRKARGDEWRRTLGDVAVHAVDDDRDLGGLRRGSGHLRLSFGERGLRRRSLVVVEVPAY